MGQKVHPIGIRLGYIRESSSKWFPESSKSGGSFAKILASDLEIRAYAAKRLPEAAGVSQILIERTGPKIRITLRTAKPGVMIGKKGEDIEKFRSDISVKIGCPADRIHINIEELRKPELDATLVARSIAQQLERRIMFRRAMKRAVASALRQGAKGIKVYVSGRLGGAEIARSEVYREGRLPLHTFRADIDYGTASAKTTYGVIGVKVWIFKGEVLTGKPQQSTQEVA
ncbi:MAG TPA: 30S ribosomal protein S3 [Gammaproteobacteria bacterium]|nr:30S ribosomal protein S3 [Gammaproteobacteria bacterium]